MGLSYLNFSYFLLIPYTFRYIITTGKISPFLMPEFIVSIAVHFQSLLDGKRYLNKLGFYEPIYDRICIFKVSYNTDFKICVSLGNKQFQG